MNIILTGTLIKIGQTEVVTEKFSKRLCVVKIEESTNYPQEISVEFTQTKTGVLDAFHVGDIVSIEANLRGNSYKDKHYVQLQGWKCTQTSSPQPPQPYNSPSVHDENLPF